MFSLSKLLITQHWIYLLIMIAGILPCTLVSMVFSRACSTMAGKLGDATPRLNGRDGWNPWLHLDAVGFLLFVTTGLGFAKDIPMKQDNFSKPIPHAGLVYLAGIGHCLLLSFVSLVLASGIYHGTNWESYWYLLWLLLDLAVCSLSFALCQCLPICGFPGAKLWTMGQEMQKKPQSWQKFQGYRSRNAYLLLFFTVLLWSGLLRSPVSALVACILKPLCTLSFFPFSMLEFYFL